jgi:FSR family fosmidomycin resistance protein-like MFS transporter
MVLRAVVGQSFLTFMPVVYVQRGYSLVAAGGIFSLFIMAGTISGLVAGHLSDRIGHKPVFFVSHLLMTPVLLLFPEPGRKLGLRRRRPGRQHRPGFPAPGRSHGPAAGSQGSFHGEQPDDGLRLRPGRRHRPCWWAKLADIYSIHTVLTWLCFLPLISVMVILRFPRVGPADTSN